MTQKKARVPVCTRAAPKDPLVFLIRFVLLVMKVSCFLPVHAIKVLSHLHVTRVSSCPDTNFPVTFVMVLGLVVVFILALAVTSYFISSMDPGRDSVVYRMTSQRLKTQ